MGGSKDAFLPVFRGNTEIRALFDNRVVAEFAENFKILVEQDGAAGEFGDEEFVATDGGGAGAAESGDRDGDDMAVGVEDLEAQILAVAHDEEGFFGIAGIDSEAVAGAELAGLVSGRAEFSEELAVLRVFVDQVRAVAVGDKNRAVGRDIDSGGIGPRAVG